MTKNCTLFDLPLNVHTKANAKACIYRWKHLSRRPRRIHLRSDTALQALQGFRERSLDAFLNLQVITEHSLSFGLEDDGAAR